jgi:16S rRNA (uracil1498-N3)-methyltransferase
MAGICRNTKAVTVKVHRFYIGNKSPREVQHFGSERMWVQDESLRHQWQNVLRLRVGEKVDIFNDESNFLYEITEIKDIEIALKKITEIERKVAKGHLLAWSLLKKDNNDLVLQKGTEIGISKFVPIISKRTEKQTFDVDRALRIIIEAAEQCGRSDIPDICDVISLEEAIGTYKNGYKLFVASPHGDGYKESEAPTGVFVGPEGGWTPEELANFDAEGVEGIRLSDFILRAETASIVAASKINGV